MMQREVRNPLCECCEIPYSVFILARDNATHNIFYINARHGDRDSSESSEQHGVGDKRRTFVIFRFKLGMTC